MFEDDTTRLQGFFDFMGKNVLIAYDYKFTILFAKKELASLFHLHVKILCIKKLLIRNERYHLEHPLDACQNMTGEHLPANTLYLWEIF